MTSGETVPQAPTTSSEEDAKANYVYYWPSCQLVDDNGRAETITLPR